jgi:hypothetical protein
MIYKDMGIAVIIDTKKILTNELASRSKISPMEAPKTFLMPISFLFCWVEYAVSPKSPKLVMSIDTNFFVFIETFYQIAKYLGVDVRELLVPGKK